ncbi:lasso peptide biosynthesis B2 protein [Endothiovibrio diazotrophicus]
MTIDKSSMIHREDGQSAAQAEDSPTMAGIDARGSGSVERPHGKGRLQRFLARSAEERWLLLEAAGWLAISRLAVRWLPFRWIAPRLGRHMAATPDTAEGEDEALLRQVAWAVAAAARHVPWEAVCLPRAMAAKAMLRRRGVASTLYLGVAGGTEMAAHAWLRAGSRVVTGDGSLGRYTVVSRFT